MGDGSEQSPYTREDVLNKIEANGGAERLNLSEKWFEQGIDLRRLNLKGIILNQANLEGALLMEANLEGAFLMEAHLKKAVLLLAHLEGAFLVGAHLEGALLQGAHLKGALLWGAHLEGAILVGAQFSPETRLEQADWGNYILGEENKGRFDDAAYVYRQLKQWYTNAGLYDIADKFFYREMEARRKAQSWKKKPHLKLWSWVLKLLCGYGEKPERVVTSAAAVIIVLTLAYFAINSVWEWSAFWRSLYFSVASFTTSAWVDETVLIVQNDMVRGLGVAESFIGIFMMALFLVTFTRKMTR